MKPHPSVGKLPLSINSLRSQGEIIGFLCDQVATEVSAQYAQIQALESSRDLLLHRLEWIANQHYSADYQQSVEVIDAARSTLKAFRELPR